MLSVLILNDGTAGAPEYGSQRDKCRQKCGQRRYQDHSRIDPITRYRFTGKCEESRSCRRQPPRKIPEQKSGQERYSGYDQRLYQIDPDDPSPGGSPAVQHNDLTLFRIDDPDGDHTDEKHHQQKQGYRDRVKDSHGGVALLPRLYQRIRQILRQILILFTELLQIILHCRRVVHRDLSVIIQPSGLTLQFLRLQLSDHSAEVVFGKPDHESVFFQTPLPEIIPGSCLLEDPNDPEGQGYTVIHGILRECFSYRKMLYIHQMPVDHDRDHSLGKILCLSRRASVQYPEMLSVIIRIHITEIKESVFSAVGEGQPAPLHPQDPLGIYHREFQVLVPGGFVSFQFGKRILRGMFRARRIHHARPCDHCRIGALLLIALTEFTLDQPVQRTLAEHHDHTEYCDHGDHAYHKSEIQLIFIFDLGNYKSQHAAHSSAITSPTESPARISLSSEY